MEGVSKLMKVKVLHIGLSKSMGGIETYILNLMKHVNLKKFQLEFLVFYKETPDFLREIINLGGIVHRVTGRDENYFKYRKELKAFFKLHSNYNIIHMHVINLSNPKPIFLAPKNTKVILHSHIAKFNLNNKRVEFFHHFYKVKAINRAESLLACSQVAGEFMYEKNSFKIIDNAIDFEQYEFNPSIRQAYRSELGLEENEIALIHVGRFEKQKNHEFLIKMFHELIQHSNKKYKLLLAGEGTLKPLIEEMVNKLELSKFISFLGVRNDVSQMLNAMDIFVLPSLYEGLPFSLVEAQVNGLKCIVSANVSNESDLNNNVKFLTINEGYTIWCDSIENFDEELEYRDNDLYNSKYDIKMAIQNLESIYDALK